MVKNQAIELAKTLSTQFAQGPGDGLLGLAFGSINTVQPTPVQTLVENMITQSDIPQNTELFTAYLGSTSPAGSTATSTSTSDATSFYTFGYVDQDALAGQTPSYTAVDNSQGFWMFNSTSAKVGNQTITRSGNTAIADTGTTLALVGDDLCEAVYGAIKGATQSTQQQVRSPSVQLILGAPPSNPTRTQHKASPAISAGIVETLRSYSAVGGIVHATEWSIIFPE